MLNISAGFFAASSCEIPSSKATRLIVSPPLLPPLFALQDETLDPMFKKVYVCEVKGCGISHGRNAKFCLDHATAAQRVETEAEFAARTKQ
jgi:hypothetical protein